MNASAERLWQVLTLPQHLQQWMLEEALEFQVGQKAGEPFCVKGNLHGIPFENKGTIVKALPGKQFSYTHQSSLSHLPDTEENYTLVEFRLQPSKLQTELVLSLSNFPTEVIYQHLVFYWKSSLAILKNYTEKS